MRTVNESINSSQLLHHACLIPNTPEPIQHQLRDVTNYAVRPLGMLFAAMSFVCNTLVVLTVAKSKSLRQPSLLMLCSLSITDVIAAIHVLVREALITTDPHFCSEPFIDVSTFLGVLCFLATLSNLTIISRDRYLAVSKASWYRNHMTRSRAFKGIISSWLASMMVTISVFYLIKTGFSYQLIFIITILFYVFCFFMIVFNYVRFLIANRRNTRILGQNMRSVVEREKKMNRVVSAILLCFLFFCFPALLGPIIFVVIRMPRDAFRTFNMLLITINGLLNPVLNYGRNKDLRIAMLNMLKCHGRNRQPQEGRNNCPRGPAKQNEDAPIEYHGDIALQEHHY